MGWQGDLPIVKGRGRGFEREKARRGSQDLVGVVSYLA